MLQKSGFLSVNFSGNMGVIKTKPGYASSIAYNIDNGNIDAILGTIAGNDTILIVTRENCTREEIFQGLQEVIAKM